MRYASESGSGRISKILAHPTVYNVPFWHLSIYTSIYLYLYQSICMCIRSCGLFLVLSIKHLYIYTFPYDYWYELIFCNLETVSPWERNLATAWFTNLYEYSCCLSFPFTNYLLLVRWAPSSEHYPTKCKI